MVLVLTPLEIERRALGTLPEGFRVEVGGHGKVEFALATQRFVTELRPRLVVLAGACGSLACGGPRGAAVGDIVVGLRTIEHDFNLKFFKRPLPAFEGDRDSIDRLRAQTFDFPVQFADIASGDEDVTTLERASEIRKLTGAAVVAWEGAGLARGARSCGIGFLELRAVTDSCGGNALTEFKANLGLGMKRIAQVLARL